MLERLLAERPVRGVAASDNSCGQTKMYRTATDNPQFLQIAFSATVRTCRLRRVFLV
jgi:hypothetical protein